MGDDEYSNNRNGYSRGYDDGYKKQYSDSKFRSYNDNQRFYRDDQRTKYGYRDSDFSSENKKNYDNEDYYKRTVRNDIYKRSNDYYSRNGDNYYKISDLDYVSRKSYNYDDYSKKPRSDTRYPNNNYDSYYSKDSTYNKTHKAKHIPAEPNCTIGVFGFNPNTTDEDLKNLLLDKLVDFSGYTYKLIMDEKTLLCKGYCFINFKCLNDAVTAKYILNCESYRGQDFKCDYSYKQGLLGE